MSPRCGEAPLKILCLRALPRPINGSTPFTYFRWLRKNKKSHERFSASVEKLIRHRPAQIADHRDAKNSVAKRGRRAREFLLLEYGRPRRLSKCRFSHTLTRKTRFCTRYRLRAEKIRFLHTFSLTDGKKLTVPSRHVQGIKTVCFPNYGRNKKPFFAYVIGYGGKKVHARILFFGR